MSRIALSTASVYPESSAHAFAYAASLGYDAVEVMVGIDALSQQTSAVKQLSDHHGLRICAIHSPCLLFTQRVWGTDPWGKLERSAEMAREVGAGTVVVHPPFRWQRDYARGFVEGIALLEERTGVERPVDAGLLEAGEQLGDGLVGADVDVFVTSDLRHHRAGEFREHGGAALVDVAHWAAEWTWLPVVEGRLGATLGDRVETRVSTLCTDPWTFRH